MSIDRLIKKTSDGFYKTTTNLYLQTTDNKKTIYVRSQYELNKAQYEKLKQVYIRGLIKCWIVLKSVKPLLFIFFGH